MRPSLASSIGVACATALAASTALTAHADDHRPRASAPGHRGLAAPVPGSTHTIALTGRASTRGMATRKGEEGVGVRALAPRTVRPFSLLGVTWDSAAARPPGAVRVRTRSVATGRWSPWRDLQVDDDDAPDSGSAEDGPQARGSTAPLWVGDSDGVEVRLGLGDVLGLGVGDLDVGLGLPDGLRLDLVTPGEDETDTEAPPEDVPPDEGTDGTRQGGDAETRTPESATDEQATTANDDVAPGGATEIPEGFPAPDLTAARHSAPRPRIVTRAGWGADESLRERKFKYTGKVRTAFVHHSATGNNYTCAQAPSVIRSIYRYHVRSSGWRDIGYNFLIDKCGTIYEGRAGGVTKAVMGAHTLGFNRDSTGIAVLGSFGRTNPPKAVTTALARLTAWKLGLSGVDAAGTSTLVSGGGKYKAGVKVRMKAVSGHRDGYNTDCPGARLYARLGSVRKAAAALQKR
jgi:N-acetylmuramoyl-L-alanine amidase